MPKRIAATGRAGNVAHAALDEPRDPGTLECVQRTITGFHRDAEGDWVAELTCGHGQHVRHKPPWTLRPWVTTDAGRASKVGASLECKRCGTIREYALTDREACLAILRGNVPKVPAVAEAQLAAFLGHPPGPYFVVEDDEGRIVACGGISVTDEDPSVAVVRWIIVQSDRRRRGLGSALTQRSLQAAPTGVRSVRVDTVPDAQGFYEKLGFAVMAMPDGIGRDLDRVRLLKHLDDSPHQRS